MSKVTTTIVVFLLVFFIGSIAVYVLDQAQDVSTDTTTTERSDAIETSSDTTTETAFSNIGLRTNTAIHSIPLSEVLGGGPVKDGIPAISNPTFISVAEAQQIEDGDRLGVAISDGSVQRFYPYSILVWHEIVNDTINDTPVAVTFCPLCGSTVTFDRRVDGVTYEFGVSGKLWESNLLMYDRTTESLWSQIIGEAVVGDLTGNKLSVFDSSVITFSDFTTAYPDGEVLSRTTGHQRNYDLYPYGDYDTNNQLIFPVSVNDTRLPTKELVHVVNTENGSVAFARNALLEAGSATITQGTTTLTATVQNSEIRVTNQNGVSLPGYTAMWFSWVTHHKDTGVLWQQ